MTYKELLEQLNEEHLNQDVAIWDDDTNEYYQSDVYFEFAEDTQDVLDLNHPVISF